VIVYVETSAVLAWLLAQARGEEVYDVLHAARFVATSRLTVAEVRRVLTRLAAAGALPPAAVGAAGAELAAEVVRWDVIDLAEPIWLRAEARFPVEPVRLLDAVHLASALHYAAAVGDVALLSLDARVLDNWRSLGLPEALPRDT
jgi:predicted nucleic acid-binding protein